MRVVYARTTQVVALPGGAMVGVQEGTHWRSDDPLVRAHPDLFSEDPRHGMLFSRPLEPEDFPGTPMPVDEQATSAPGERRSAVRRG